MNQQSSSFTLDGGRSTVSKLDAAGTSHMVTLGSSACVCCYAGGKLRAGKSIRKSIKKRSCWVFGKQNRNQTGQSKARLCIKAIFVRMSSSKLDDWKTKESCQHCCHGSQQRFVCAQSNLPGRPEQIKVRKSENHQTLQPKFFHNWANNVSKTRWDACNRSEKSLLNYAH